MPLAPSPPGEGEGAGDGEEAGERFAVLGSTGNVYTVRVGVVPECDCPDFGKVRRPAIPRTCVGQVC